MLRPVACIKDGALEWVSDFINRDFVTWNVEALNNYFLPMDVENICKTPLSTRRQVDLWAWNYDHSGILSVRSVYRMLIITRKRR